MGLFDRIKGDGESAKTEDVVQTFDSIVIDSQDVVRELKNVASANKVNPNIVDFNILKISTLYKLKGEEEWTEIDESGLKIFDDDAFFINPELKIEQHYKIEIFDSRAQVSVTQLPDVSLGANKNLTRVIATVKKSIDIRYTSDFENYLIEAINKKKFAPKFSLECAKAQCAKRSRKLHPWFE